jgi:hypothetical protein
MAVWENRRQPVSIRTENHTAQVLDGARAESDPMANESGITVGIAFGHSFGCYGSPDLSLFDLNPGRRFR